MEPKIGKLFQELDIWSDRGREFIVYVRFIEDQAFSPSYYLAPPPPPLISSRGCLSFSVFWVLPVMLTDGRGGMGRGGGVESFHSTERKVWLVLYKSFNTLWLGFFCCKPASSASRSRNNTLCTHIPTWNIPNCLKLFNCWHCKDQKPDPNEKNADFFSRKTLNTHADAVITGKKTTFCLIVYGNKIKYNFSD